MFAFRDTAGVMQLHAEIHAEDQDRQVESYTYAVAPGNLFVELIKEEHAARLGVVITDSPYIAGIQERRQLQEL